MGILVGCKPTRGEQNMSDLWVDMRTQLSCVCLSACLSEPSMWFTTVFSFISERSDHNFTFFFNINF